MSEPINHNQNPMDSKNASMSDKDKTIMDAVVATKGKMGVYHVSRNPNKTPEADIQEVFDKYGRPEFSYWVIEGEIQQCSHEGKNGRPSNLNGESKFLFRGGCNRVDQLGKWVVVRSLRPGDSYHKDLIRVIELIGNLDGVMKILATAKSGSGSKDRLIMERMDGDLEKHMRGSKKPEIVVDLFKQVLVSVKRMHEEGVPHLDLKLANILIKDGKTYLNDFDLSREFVGNKKRPLIGTFQYVPRETVLSMAKDSHHYDYLVDSITHCLEHSFGTLERLFAGMNAETNDDYAKIDRMMKIFDAKTYSSREVAEYIMYYLGELADEAPAAYDFYGACKQDIFSLGVCLEEMLDAAKIEKPGLRKIVKKMTDQDMSKRASIEEILEEFKRFEGVEQEVKDLFKKLNSLKSESDLDELVLSYERLKKFASES